jgi:hypothetical protein
MNDVFLYRQAWRFDGAPHEEPQLQEPEWKTLLKQGGLMVRNTYNFDCQQETSFWYVIKDQYQGMEELPSRVRNKVRHAEQYFDYQEVSFETIQGNAYPILKETYDDYAVRDTKMNPAVFEEYLNHCKKRQFDYWGIFEKESQQMVGFCTVRMWDHCCEYEVTGIESKYKKGGFYPYYGLYQHLNQHYLEEQHFNYVSDSARTITEHSNIQDFLIENFGFRKAYCQLAVYYQGWVKFAVKVLYPFRSFITLPRVKAILNMEAMQRGKQ